SRIVEKPACMKLFRAELLEGIADEARRRFARIALAPEGPSQPIAELPASCGMHAADPNIGLVGLAQNGEGQVLPGPPRMGGPDDEGAGIILRVRMRYPG